MDNRSSIRLDKGRILALKRSRARSTCAVCGGHVLATDRVTAMVFSDGTTMQIAGLQHERCPVKVVDRAAS